MCMLQGTGAVAPVRLELRLTALVAAMHQRVSQLSRTSRAASRVNPKDTEALL
jgi:hypothetical protein